MCVSRGEASEQGRGCVGVEKGDGVWRRKERDWECVKEGERDAER